MGQSAQALNLSFLKQTDYLSIWNAMQIFTNNRKEDTYDEIWLLEHDPVFTQGQNGAAKHIINPGQIPVIQSDRGGQVTYHGPGQLMVYALIDLKRKKFNVRELVNKLEQSIIDLLTDFDIPAYSQIKAPGVYVEEKKICSIGLRIRRGYSYHGMAFNFDLNLDPFDRIHPCGFKTLKMTRLIDLIGPSNPIPIGQKLINYIMKNLMYTTAHTINKDKTCRWGVDETTRH